MLKTFQSNSLTGHLGSDTLGLYDRLKLILEPEKYYSPGIATEIIIHYNTSNIAELIILLLIKYSRELLCEEYNFIGIKTYERSQVLQTNALTVIVLINEFFENKQIIETDDLKETTNNNSTKLL